ncbi:hypothetical protein TNCV_4298921 [Trichonephila clavipes]|nr:hypothetical protein TNCV_4298921 [Trichonephila clavipes]
MNGMASLFSKHESNRARLGRSRKTSCSPPPPPPPTNSPRTGKSSSGRMGRIPQLVINSLIDSMPQRCSTLLSVPGNHTPY